jgi:hypothetical protein
MLRYIFIKHKNCRENIYLEYKAKLSSVLHDVDYDYDNLLLNKT